MEKLLIGLIGVVVGSTLTLLREFWSEQRTRKKRAAYLAVRATGILERFIDGCTSVVGDNGIEDERGCSRSQYSCPEIDFESLDVDWQSLPFDLMYEIINFPSYVEEANGLIDSVIEYVASPPDYSDFFEERQLQYAKLGLKANDLSTRLRIKYGMPKKEYENWDPIDALSKGQSKIESIKDKRAKEHEKFRKNIITS